MVGTAIGSLSRRCLLGRGCAPRARLGGKRRPNYSRRQRGSRYGPIARAAKWRQIARTITALMGAPPSMSTSIATPQHSLSPTYDRAAVHTYAAFGGFLRSEIEFPELTRAPDRALANWMVAVDHREPAWEEFVPIGERRIGHEQYRLWRGPGGLRLEYSHAGTFDLLSDGSRIVWYYRADALPELVRSIIIGPVIALALELGGFLCLHGSAVTIESRAIAFLGPKHFGKSTLATALTTAGAKLIGDDLLVVNPGDRKSTRLHYSH